jgi:hypothetical protein
MTTTIEHAEKLEVQAVYVRAGGYMKAARYMDEAAQRLRELDKPDCVWAHDGFGSSDTSCGTWVYNLTPSSAKFCPNCGGAVKSGGTPNE